MRISSIVGESPPKYGFQKSENTRAAVIVYQHNDDPIILNTQKSSDPQALTGNKATDSESSVINVTTTKTLSEASGKFAITLKPSRVSADLFHRITDDDWVDIVYYINKEPYHSFRGIIDEINRSVTVSNGATVSTYTIVGRCFGKVWEATPVWFSPYYNDIITQAVSSRVLNTIPELLDAPDKAAYFYLKGFLEELASQKGVNWLPPKGMPGIETNTFLGNVEFNELLGGSRYFQNIPKRQEFNANALMPEGTLWDLAKTYSDPMFTELYVDYLPKGDPFSKNMSAPLALGDGEMSVIMRDKPFPVLASSVPSGYENTWDRLPVFTVQPQEMISHEVSRAGYERYNAFFVASKLLQEDAKNYALTILPPLMDADSIRRHGFRRFDIESSVHPAGDNAPSAGGFNVEEMAIYQRQIVRDWYCLNPYMLSGTIVLGHGRPDIRIGCRLHIPGINLGSKKTIPEENYYIESVTHDWNFGIGIRTTIGVTRGWLGDSSSYYNNLAKMAARYSVPKLEEPLGL